MSDVEKGVAQGAFAEVRAVLQLAPLVVLLAVLAPRLAGSAALALGGFTALVMVARRALKRNHARAARETEALLGAADEAVRHADLWATYGAEGRIRAHVARLGRTIIATSSRLRARTALLSHTSEVLGALALVLTLALMGAGRHRRRRSWRHRALRDRVLHGVQAAPRAGRRPARASPRGGRARGGARARDGDRSLATIREPAAARPAREWPLATLTVKGLVGRHGAHEPLSLVLPPGKVAAIVGPTGIGKTSLLRALLGLEAPREGTIAWGDEELSQQRRRPEGATVRVGPSGRAGSRRHARRERRARRSTDGRTPTPRMRRVCSATSARRASSRRSATRCSSPSAPCPAASASGSRSAARSRRACPSSCSTNRRARSTAPRRSGCSRAIAGLRGKRTVVIVTHRPEPLAIADVVVRLSSDGENAQHRTRGDDDTLGSQQLSIEDVGAAALEAQLERPRERVDVPGAE